MTVPPALLPPPEVQVPRWRFWGARQPPKNRADMFSVQPAAIGTNVGSGLPAQQVATLRLYGPIDSFGWPFGISAEDVADALDGLPEDVLEVRVRINSPGGEAWEGTAVLNLLRAHRAHIVAVVDGIAASAASVIAVGCDETVMSPGTQLMVHDASAFAWGPAETMRKAARFLDSVSDSLASIYAETAGGTVAAWRAVMVEETWYTAQEAVAADLADRVAVVPDSGATTTAGEDEPSLDDSDGVEDRFDLSMYAHAGRSAAPPPRAPGAHAPGRTTPPKPTTQKDRSDAVAEISDEQLNTLRQQLGCDADADLDTVLAALPEALAERADTDTPDPSGSTSGRAEVPEGMTLVETDVLATLQTGARDGAAARAQQLRDERDRMLSAAVGDGRITPASRVRWQTRWDADADGTRELLAALPEGLVPLDERGHDGSPEPVAASTVSTVVDSDAYKNWSLS